MKLNSDNIREEDRKLAISLYNSIKQGNRCVGSPAEGLKETLKKLEAEESKGKEKVTDWLLDDKERKETIMKLRAGIKGEEDLANFLTLLLKESKDLDGVIAFASLSYEQENNDKDYIPDSDFLLIYGTNILIVDAKNISTNPDVPIWLNNGVIETVEKGKFILEVHQSTHIWEKVLNDKGLKFDTMDGYVCIVNTSGATIKRNEEWENSHTKLIHISELYQELLKWVEQCKTDNTDICYLATLTEIAKAQIRKEKSGLDLEKMKRQFGV